MAGLPAYTLTHILSHQLWTGCNISQQLMDDICTFVFPLESMYFILQHDYQVKILI